MNREEIFEKYGITDRHDVWSADVDNHMSIELFKMMHDGRTPMEDDSAVKWVTEFLDKTMSKDPSFMDELKQRHDWGVLLLTARRMVCIYADDILEELNQPSPAEALREVGNNLLSQPYEDPFDEQ